jgi:hypothetical protein
MSISVPNFRWLIREMSLPSPQLESINRYLALRLSDQTTIVTFFLELKTPIVEIFTDARHLGHYLSNVLHAVLYGRMPSWAA